MTHLFSRNERWALAVLTALFILAAVAPNLLSIEQHIYLPLHTVLEIGAVAVAFLIFIVGWQSWLRTPPLPITLIGCGFFGVGLLDIAHLLSFQGMPVFVTASGPEKAINFWLAARFLAAAVLLLAACLSWQQQSPRWSRYLALGIVLVLVAAISAAGLWFQEQLPASFEPGVGLTRFKVASEWGLVTLCGLTAVILWRRRTAIDDIDVSALILAVLITAQSELFFTMYGEVTDLYNLLGHVYKIAAYYYFYRALAASGIDLPYHQLDDSKRRMQATLDAMPDMLFELDARGVVHHFHSQRDETFLPPTEFLGKSIYPLVPAEVGAVTREALQDVIDTGFTEGRQYELVIDGSPSWYELSGSKLNVSTHREQRYLLLVRNITNRKRAEQERDRLQSILYTALDNLPLGLAINSVGHEVGFEYMNERFPAIYGVTREQLLQPDGFWRSVYRDPELRERVKQQVLADVESGDVERMYWDDVPLRDEQGRTRYISARNIPLPIEGLWLSTVTDVTAQHRAEEELRIAAAAFNSQEGIVVTDAERRVLRVNPAFTEVTGLSSALVRGMMLEDLLIAGEDGELLGSIIHRLAHTGHWRGELWLRHADGQRYPQRTTLTAVTDARGRVSHYIADLIDTTALREAEQQIEHLELFDPLTGLANRYLLMRRLQQAIVDHQKRDQYGALLYFDIDHFKTINDTLGHQSGDQLLIRIAEKLRGQIAPRQFVARSAADEFMMIVADCGALPEDAATAAQRQAQKLLQELNGLYEIDSKAYYSTCSVGITLFGQGATDAIEVFKQADIAMHQAKQQDDVSISFFDPAMEDALLARVSLDQELREALARRQFALYYQPKVQANGTIVGAEALIRWHHPERGIVLPGEFIPAAEASGLIQDIERWVLETAIVQLQHWQQMPSHAHLSLNVNVTSNQFHRPDFVVLLEQLIAEHPIDPAGLMLELTESTLIADLETTRTRIERLRSLGVRFAIDDFGTGYSSLTYLSRLPLDQLKIDQSFVRGIGCDESSSSIVRAVIEMAHALGLEVLAEGVETREQLAFLTQEHCDLYQGYLFGHPLPVEQLQVS